MFLSRQIKSDSHQVDPSLINSPKNLNKKYCRWPQSVPTFSKDILEMRGISDKILNLPICSQTHWAGTIPSNMFDN